MAGATSNCCRLGAFCVHHTAMHHVTSCTATCESIGVFSGSITSCLELLLLASASCVHSASFLFTFGRVGFVYCFLFLPLHRRPDITVLVDWSSNTMILTYSVLCFVCLCVRACVRACVWGEVVCVCVRA